MPMIGQPIFTARSMTLTIFSAKTSPRLPPKTVKSWLKTKTRRPSMVPWPVTTPSPQGRLSSSPKPWARWRVNMSSSVKVPGSSSRSMRSRAVSLPRACWRSTAASVPAWRASSRSARRRSRFSSALTRSAAGIRSYSPNSSRSTPQTSPTVARARSASRIGGSRLPVPARPRRARRPGGARPRRRRRAPARRRAQPRDLVGLDRPGRCAGAAPAASSSSHVGVDADHHPLAGRRPPRGGGRRRRRWPRA